MEEKTSIKMESEYFKLEEGLDVCGHIVYMTIYSLQLGKLILISIEIVN